MWEVGMGAGRRSGRGRAGGTGAVAPDQISGVGGRYGGREEVREGKGGWHWCRGT